MAVAVWDISDCVCSTCLLVLLARVHSSQSHTQVLVSLVDVDKIALSCLAPQALLVSCIGDLGTVVSSPALVLCTSSPSLYEELYPAGKPPAAAEAPAAAPSAGVASSGTAAPCSGSQLGLQQRYQVVQDVSGVALMAETLEGAALRGSATAAGAPGPGPAGTHVRAQYAQHVADGAAQLIIALLQLRLYGAVQFLLERLHRCGVVSIKGAEALQELAAAGNPGSGGGGGGSAAPPAGAAEQAGGSAVQMPQQVGAKERRRNQPAV